MEGIQKKLEKCKCKHGMHYERCITRGERCACPNCSNIDTGKENSCVSNMDVINCESNYIAINKRDVEGSRRARLTAHVYRPEICSGRRGKSVDSIVVIKQRKKKRKKVKMAVLIEIKRSSARIEGLLDRDLSGVLELFKLQKSENELKKCLKRFETPSFNEEEIDELIRHFRPYRQLRSTKKWLKSENNVKLIYRVLIAEAGFSRESYKKNQSEEVTEYNGIFRPFPLQKAEELHNEKGCFCSGKEECNTCKEKEEFWNDLMDEREYTRLLK